jgi:hypothetical protein
MIPLPSKLLKRQLAKISVKFGLTFVVIILFLCHLELHINAARHFLK